MGLDRGYFEGIPAQEILANCVLMKVPRAEWPNVRIGIRIMVNAAKPILNAKK